jgi:hypothetical protein
MGFYWLGMLIISVLLIASGALVLGLAAGLLVGRLCRPAWMRVLVPLFGCGAGIVLGVTYWLNHVASIRGQHEVEVGRAVWEASWPLGLGLWVAGLVVVVALMVRRAARDLREADQSAGALLARKPCFLCGKRLRADEVEARVCRPCRA